MIKYYHMGYRTLETNQLNGEPQITMPSDDELKNFIHLVEKLIKDVQKCQEAYREKMEQDRHEADELRNTYASSKLVSKSAKTFTKSRERRASVTSSSRESKNASSSSPTLSPHPTGRNGLSGSMSSYNSSPGSSPPSSPSQVATTPSENSMFSHESSKSSNPGAGKKIFFPPKSDGKFGLEESPKLIFKPVPLAEHTHKDRETCTDLWLKSDSSHISDQTNQQSSRMQKSITTDNSRRNSSDRASSPEMEAKPDTGRVPQSKHRDASPKSKDSEVQPGPTQSLIRKSRLLATTRSAKELQVEQGRLNMFFEEMSRQESLSVLCLDRSLRRNSPPSVSERTSIHSARFTMRRATFQGLDAEIPSKCNARTRLKNLGRSFLDTSKFISGTAIRGNVHKVEVASARNDHSCSETDRTSILGSLRKTGRAVSSKAAWFMDNLERVPSRKKLEKKKTTGSRLRELYRAGSESTRKSWMWAKHRLSFGSHKNLNHDEWEDSDMDISDQLLRMDRHELNATDDEERKFVINGESKVWMYWQRFMLAVTTLSIGIGTFFIAFVEDLEDRRILSEAHALCAIDILCGMDLVIPFFVTYPDPTTLHYVTSYRRIANHYIFQGDLLIQLLAATPFFILLRCGLVSMQTLWWLPFLRMPKLMLTLLFDKGFETVVQKLPMIYRAFKMSFIFFLILHLLACAFWHIMYVHGFSTSMSPGPEVYSSSTGVMYNHAVFKSLLVLSASDLVAEKNSEEYFIIIGLFTAFLVNGVLIGSFSNLFSENGTMLARKNQAQGISNFMREMRIPKSLQGNITRFLDFQWDVGQNMYMRSMFDELPAKIKLALEMQLQKIFVEKAPLIKELPPAGVFSLIRALQPRIAQPQEVVINQGERGRSMYFISNGMVRIYLGDHSVTTYLVTLGPGNQFGEIALMKGCTRIANCKATSFTELYEMGQKEFQYFCGTYSLFEEMMSYMTQQRLKITRTVRDAQKVKSKLGLEAEMHEPFRHAMKRGYNRIKASMRESFANSSKASSYFSDNSSYLNSSSKNLSSGSSRLRIRKMTTLFSRRKRFQIDPNSGSYENTLHPRFMNQLNSPKTHHGPKRHVRKRRNVLFYNAVRHVDDMSMSEIEGKKRFGYQNIDHSDSYFIKRKSISKSYLKSKEILEAHDSDPEGGLDVKTFGSPKFFFQHDEDVQISSPISKFSPSSKENSCGNGFDDYDITSEDDTIVQSIRSYSDTRSSQRVPEASGRNLQALFESRSSSDSEPRSDSESKLLPNP